MVAPSPPRSGKSHCIHLSREKNNIGRAISTSFWKAAPSSPWSGKSNRIHLSRDEYNLGRTVSTSVWKVALYPPQSRGTQSWSRRLHLVLESSALSALVWKVESYPPQSRGTQSWSRRLHFHLGLESRAVSTSVARNTILVAPSPPRSGKSRCIHLSREEYNLGRAVSTSVWKVALYPPQSREK